MTIITKMSPEFKLIQQFFTKPNQHTDLSIGDDAALFQVQAGHQLAVSTDMLIEGTHFYPDVNPQTLGWKSLAVNLSDMAAMGAQAKWATLAIALPEVRPEWLESFAKGLFACADKFGIDIIGGDTTKGSLSISITIMGETPINKALTRAGAKAGDDLWLSGELGNAALGLQQLQGKQSLPEPYVHQALADLHTPQPRCALGLALRDIASSCIDLSDGLLADLGHILKASEVGAHLSLNRCPVNPAIANQMSDPDIQTAVLAGGEDYELCFTAPSTLRASIDQLSHDLGLTITRIGAIHSDQELTVLYDDKPMTLSAQGYDHFAQP